MEVSSMCKECGCGPDSEVTIKKVDEEEEEEKEE